MGYKVLLVDHGSGTVERLRESLERAGHDISRVAGVVEALIAVERTHPDLVMIDDGGAEAAITALCGRLKDEERGKHMPVIVLVDRPMRTQDQPDRRRQRIGCDRVVEATIPVDALMELCAELLGGPSAPALDPEPPRDIASGFAIEQANRDSASAESFSTAIETPLRDGSPLADIAPDDGGRDIEECLDSLFAAPAPQGPTSGGTQASRPGPLPTASRAPEVVPDASESTEPTGPRVPPDSGSATPPAAPSSATRPTGPPAGPREVRPEAARIAVPKRAKPPTARSAPDRGATRPASARSRPPGGSAAVPSAAADANPQRIANPDLPSRATRHPSSSDAGVDTEPHPTVRRTPNAVVRLTQPRISGRPVETRGQGPAPWAWIAAGAAVVLVAIVAGWLLIRPDDSETPAPDRPQTHTARTGTPAPTEVSDALPSPPSLDETSDVDYTGPSFPQEPETAAAVDTDVGPRPAPGPTGRTGDSPAAGTVPEVSSGAAAVIASPEEPARPIETNRTDEGRAEAPTTPRDANPPTVAAAPREPAPPEAAQRFEHAGDTARSTPRRDAAGDTKTTQAPAEEADRGVSEPPAGPARPPAATPPATAAREAADARGPSTAPAPDSGPAEPAPATANREVVPPEVLERFEPIYSPGALKKAPRGAVVILRILVDSHGRISRVVVDLGIPGSELEAAAISAVLRWRFRPGTEAGKPVDAWTTVRFEFDR